MSLIDAKFDSMEFYDYNHVEIYEQINENISFLKMYLSFLESKNIKYKVCSRPENRFYVTCALHRNVDTSLTIAENDKIWCCYGCGSEGKITDFVMKAYGFSYDNLNIVFKILISFVNNTPETLNEQELQIYNELFGNYFSPEKEIYFKESQIKTEYLYKRILDYCDYLEKKGKEINYKQISDRLSCSVGFAKKIIFKNHR